MQRKPRVVWRSQPKRSMSAGIVVPSASICSAWPFLVSRSGLGSGWVGNFSASFLAAAFASAFVGFFEARAAFTASFFGAGFAAVFLAAFLGATTFFLVM